MIFFVFNQLFVISEEKKDKKKRASEGAASSDAWDLDSIKEFMSASKTPMPKTEEKFNNFITNRFRVTDKKV